VAVVLTAATCAVAAGARSFVAVAEWVADLPIRVAAVLGADRRCPSESAIHRLVGKVDADRFDTVIGAFVGDPQRRRRTGRAAAGARGGRQDPARATRGRT
jgi:hypothetical protein